MTTVLADGTTSVAALLGWMLGRTSRVASMSQRVLE